MSSSLTTTAADRRAWLERNLRIPREAIAEFCRRNHISKLSFFGSVIREDFEPESDVDVLVEFEPGKTPGLAFFGMQDELGEMLGRNVDLHTKRGISRHFVDKVIAEAAPVYVGA